MSSYDSVSPVGEIVSDHYLSEQFPARVRTLRKDWAEREEHDKTTPRSGLMALAGDIGPALVRARDLPTGRREPALRELYARTREALGLEAPRSRWEFERAGTWQQVDAVMHRTPSGVHLAVLDTHDAETSDDLLDRDGSGHLLTGVQSADGETVETATAAVVSAVFLADHPEPPRLVLVQAGGWLLLAEKERWAEGRYLLVDLATAAERRDTKAAGELETIAALVGAESLLPGPDGSCGFLDVLSDSVNHAVGVSKDLREGVRESIECVAREVLARRRTSGLADDDTPDLARALTLQSLRYLYRVLFLLYAEARPELGVLPVGAPEYAAGYGLDRLRDLTLTEMTSDTARQGTHLYESLGTLFRLVNAGSAGGEDGLTFEGLRADLFESTATPLIDEVGLGNEALQQVLRRLLLSKARRGRDRGFVSYGQLGINQLGAVYEGLMSYGGLLAPTDVIEVARDGDPDKGSWLVPLADFDASGIDPSHRVMREDPETGQRSPLVHRAGDFVLRLSGRDRQRSASYYTPQVLTACVVEHSLAELLDQDGTRTPAADLLRWRICEPALGSGAFLVEAIDQIAREYLTRAQAEHNRTIDPEAYPAELQKVKAHLALHCSYGVDLNATAVELAEISLWLGSIHPGLKAPWFGLRLRRGNSLIGARRAVYTKEQYEKARWWKEVPVDRSRALDAGAEGLMLDDEVHHFLLPAEGWGAVADTKEARELRPDDTQTLKDWRKAVRRAPSTADRKRLADLARRVETLWRLAAVRLAIAEAESRRDIDVWGATDLPTSRGEVSRETIESSLGDPDGAYRRLRRVMDAWCALWFWPVTAEHDGGRVAPPTWEQWLSGLEGLLGLHVAQSTTGGRRAPGEGQVDLFDSEPTWDELDAVEANNLALAQVAPVSDVVREHPWLEVAARIADKEGFHHWELDFAPVSEAGGFDLQLGNPPWVRPDWDDNLVLSETDAWFSLAFKPASTEVLNRRAAQLRRQVEHRRYLVERASMAGMSEHLGSEVDRPLLAGLQPDLYRCFIELTWRHMAPTGIAGLIHPESHFTEGRAGAMRQSVYEHLRRHWQFRNEHRLFEIHNAKEFGISVYGVARSPRFLNASSIYLPETISSSLRHDGSGVAPGIKDDDGDWDVRPHAERLVRIDDSVLQTWANLIDEPGTAPREARMLRPVNTASQLVLDKLAAARRFAEVNFSWTSGWHEKADRQLGFFNSRSRVPTKWREAILQGPHFSVATPFSKQPRPTMLNNKDYEPWDLGSLPERAIPRTSYQPAKSYDEYIAGYPRWEGRPSNEYFRLAWRRMADSSTERTLFATLIPPGPTHVHGVLSLTAPRTQQVVAAGMWASLVSDFLVKVSGSSEINQSVIRRLPHPIDHPLTSFLSLRALRLNCLTADYEPLWSEIFDEFGSQWTTDAWTTGPFDVDRPAHRTAMSDVTRDWTMATPLRTDYDRRQALVELDALAAVMLDITADELCAIYRTQFGVLRKYERRDRYDNNGRKVDPAVVKAHDAWVAGGSSGRAPDLGRFEPPFVGFDREVDMTRAHDHFTARLQERQA